jgi:hypothetical protein
MPSIADSYFGVYIFCRERDKHAGTSFGPVRIHIPSNINAVGCFGDNGAGGDADYLHVYQLHDLPHRGCG